MATAQNADVSALSYEQARDELIRVVSELEQGAPTLEQSLALWERGEAAAQRCEQWLLGAKERLSAARSGTAQSGAVQSGAVQSGAVQSGAVQSGAVQAGATQAGAARPASADQ